MTYSEKLKDPRWQKRRLDILQRDKFQCKKCLETSKTLHVHHRYYLSGVEPWDHPDNVLITLCCDCHEVEGNNRIMSTSFLNGLRGIGFFNSDFEALIIPAENDRPFLKQTILTKDDVQSFFRMGWDREFVTQFRHLINEYTKRMEKISDHFDF